MGSNPWRIYSTDLLAWLVVFLGALTPANSIRLYQSRAQTITRLGGNEVKIHVGSCRQSSNLASCNYASDTSFEQEPSQCALTNLEDRPYWIAILESPAYISTVTLLNVEASHIPSASIDGLTNFMMMVNDEVCFNYRSNETFSQRKLGCDAVGDELVIQSDLSQGFLGLCDVNIFGLPLKFPSLLRDASRLATYPKEPCAMMSDESGRCFVAIDGVTLVDAINCIMIENQLNPWVELYLDKPAIVQRIHLYSTDLTRVLVLINRRKCGEYASGDMQPWVIHCEYFGDTVRIERQDEGTLKICEVQLFGHVADVDPLQKYRPLGCHKDDQGDRDLTQMVSSTRMTIDKCFNSCKRVGTKHFGVQAGKFCFCGDTFGKHGTAEETACSTKCQGEPMEMCGGTGTNSVFEII